MIKTKESQAVFDYSCKQTYKLGNGKFMNNQHTTSNFGPIFLRRSRLYVLSFMFRFMFANICFEKNQNIKVHFMFITKHNMK